MRSVMWGWRPSPPKWPSPIRSPRRMPDSRTPGRTAGVGVEILVSPGCFTVGFPVEHEPSCFTVKFPVKRVPLSMGAVGPTMRRVSYLGLVKRPSGWRGEHGSQAAGDVAGGLREGNRGSLAGAFDGGRDVGAVFALS